MAVSPDNRIGVVRKIVDKIRREPYVLLPAAVLFAIHPIQVVTAEIGNLLATTPSVRALNEASERDRLAQEAALKAQQDALKVDFEKTDGVDRVPTAKKSWEFTITRPSAVLASSPQEVLGRVTKRIVDETGCESVVISVAHIDQTRWFWDTPKPLTYSAAAVDCPK